jgi:transposase InsO family protein
VLVDHPNQVLVGDITYVQTEEGFAYLALVTEVYSRKTESYDVSESLSIEKRLRALMMALSEAIEKAIPPRWSGTKWQKRFYRCFKYWFLFASIIFEITLEASSSL